MRRLVIGLIGSASLVVGAACTTDPPATGDGSPPFRFGPEQAKDYRTVIPGYTVVDGLDKGKRHVFAAKKRDDNTGNAALDLLREEGDTINLATRAEPLSVQVSHGEPARAVFVDTPTEDGIGTLVLVDGLLSETPAKKPVPQGQRVPAEGAWWGRNGNELLFLANYSGETFRGTLFWSNGTSSTKVGDATTSAAVRLLPDRNAAIVGLDLNTSGVGRLVRVSLADGATDDIATDVRVLNAQRRVNFALSANGSTVVFVGADGAVRKVSASSGEAATVASAGAVPGVSSDGDVVAFFADGKTYAAGSAGVVELGVAPQNTLAAPVISEDGQWAFWCDSVELSPGPLGAKGFVARTDGSTAALQVATNVACDRAGFVGDQLAVIASLERFGRGRYDGFGTVYQGPAGQQLVELTAGALADVARTVAGPGLSWVGNQNQGTSVGEAFFVLAGGDAKSLRGNVLSRTLRVSPDGSRVLFLADPEGTLDGAAVASAYATKTLTSGGAVEKVSKSGSNGASTFIAAEFGKDSRVVAVSADGSVWSFPAPK